jgi:tRNA A37 threonylcarbamoyltransferase TsaD
VAAQGGITVQDRRDLCAGFQAAVADVLAENRARAWRLSGDYRLCRGGRGGGQCHAFARG